MRVALIACVLACASVVYGVPAPPRPPTPPGGWPGGVPPPPPPGGWRKPNVLMMLADDMGSGDLGYVNSEVKTPIIDALAAEGVILTNNYVMNVCTPTRHCVMTGRYPFKTQMAHIVIGYIQQLCTPINIKMMPQYMKDAGYNTYMSGKWHLGLCREECLPTSRGFDHFWGFYQGEQEYYDHTSGSGDVIGYDWRDGTDIDWSVKGTFNMFLMNDWIVDNIRNYNDDKPFFYYIAWTAPHTPHECPSKYSDIYPDIPSPRKEYLGLVSSLDEAIGNVTQALKDSGQYDNTLIIFSSDNGGEHGGAATNGMKRGSKGSMFEGGIKALGFVHGSMLTKTGYEHAGLFHATDWLPTIMGIIGADGFDADARHIDGHDQSDMILNGGDSKRDDFVYNIDMMDFHMMGQSAVRKGDFKYLWGGYGASDGYISQGNLTLFYADQNARDAVGVSSAYVAPPPEKRSAFDFSADNTAVMASILAMWAWDPTDRSKGLDYLFNIKDDPYEYNNLADDPAYADKVNEMKDFVIQQYTSNYVETIGVAKDNNADGKPENFNGTWSTGWCDDVPQLQPGEPATI